jgi:hypothetical protein
VLAKLGQYFAEALLAISTELVDLATKDTECYSRCLLSLRQHRELTRLERLGYYRLVDALWPDESPK